MPSYPVLLVPGSHIAQKGLQTSFLTPQAFEEHHLGSAESFVLSAAFQVSLTKNSLKPK